MGTLFEHFSHRSKMVVFLTRMDAGRRGATALEPGDLLEAIINEDQGELPEFVDGIPLSGPIREPEPFFTAEVASKALLRLHSILPQQEPVSDSVDMSVSPRVQDILHAARALAGEMHHGEVQPLHLVAAILAEETSKPAEILKEAGISKEAVMQALRNQMV